MSNLNVVTLIGRLTKDPELRYTQDGTAVANFSLAINEYHTDQAGNKKENTLFVECEAWRKNAENVSEFIKKGKGLIVHGKLKLDKWEKDGVKRSKLKVVAKSIKFFPKDHAVKNPIPVEEEQSAPV